MQALVFRGERHVALETVPMPTLEDAGHAAAATAAIVRIQLCGLCGSDMHPYHCREKGLDHGTVCGHEFVGTVHATGANVAKFRPGDKVMSPFTTSCGECFFCRKGLTGRCDHSRIYGWVEGGKGLHGAQAQYILVPMADSTLVAIPEGVTDEEALLLGDVFSTGYFCADNAGIREYARKHGEGPVVAIIGVGPVGLMACIGAADLGAKSVLAIDSVPERLRLAEKYSAVAVDRGACDPVAAVHAVTDGRGADVVLEAVGFPAALELACQVARCGATVSSCGCHSAAAAPMVTLYNKNLTLKSGRCPARCAACGHVPLMAQEQCQLECRKNSEDMAMNL